MKLGIVLAVASLIGVTYSTNQVLANRVAAEPGKTTLQVFGSGYACVGTKCQPDAAEQLCKTDPGVFGINKTVYYPGPTCANDLQPGQYSHCKSGPEAYCYKIFPYQTEDCTGTAGPFYGWRLTHFCTWP